MKEILYHIVMVTFAVFLLPLAVLLTVAWCYSQLMMAIYEKPIDYGVARQPRWFVIYTNYLVKLTDTMYGD